MPDHYRSRPPSPAEVLAHSGVTADGDIRAWEGDDGVTTPWLGRGVVVDGIACFGTTPFCSFGNVFRWRPVLLRHGDVTPVEWPLDADGFQRFPPTDAQRERWRIWDVDMAGECARYEIVTVAHPWNWMDGWRCRPVED